MSASSARVIPGSLSQRSFSTTATTKAITWHDLRATGCTWMAIAGVDPAKIQQRAGHERYDTTQRYVREAENLREGFGDVFPPLPPLAAQTRKRVTPSRTPPSRVLSSSWTGLPDGGSQPLDMLAGRTGLEPAASGVTGRRYNQLNYRPNSIVLFLATSTAACDC
jgi:hypothetical protein